MQDHSQPLVVLMEDDPIIHTAESQFCSIDPTCLAHAVKVFLAQKG